MGEKPEEVAEIEENANVEETQEEIGETPEEDSELSSSQRIQLRIDELQEKQHKAHLKEEEKQLKDIKCANCGSKNIKPVKSAKNRTYGVKPKDYMQLGSKADDYECKDCGHMTYVSVTYNIAPEENGSAELIVQDKGYPWQQYIPAELSDDHIKGWISEQAELVKENQSPLSTDLQRLVRGLDLALNK